MLFIAWYDDKPRVTIAQKIADACEAYQARFGIAPDVALICPEDAPAPADALVSVHTRATIRKNTVWVGREG